jgi:hypothetical protein
MRIRISLLSPFQPAKYLIPLPLEVTTITDLKRHLILSLSALSEHAKTYRDIKLEIGGFELLAGSEIQVIEDGDIIECVLSCGHGRG